MMKRNFKVLSTVEVEVGNRRIDLHNDFDFKLIVFETSASTLTFVWESRVAPAETVSLHIEELDALLLKGVDPEMPRAEDARLSFLGYVHPEDVDLLDGFLPETDQVEDHHFIVAFEGGLVAKAHGTRATISRSRSTETEEVKPLS